MTPPPLPSELVKSHTERMAAEERDRAEKRRLQLAEQRSDLNSPEQRIRAWEKMHGLHLPTDPEHPVLDVIAVSTRLTLGEVQREQRQRAERATNSNEST